MSEGVTHLETLLDLFQYDDKVKTAGTGNHALPQARK